MSICLHLEEKSSCSSTIKSSSQLNFRGRTLPNSTCFPLSFHAKFAHLDKMVWNSEQDTDESSTSDLQMPDNYKMEDFPGSSFQEILKYSDVSAPPSHQHQVKNIPNPKHSKIPRQNSKQHGLEVKQKDTSGKIVYLKNLLYIYLILVCFLVLLTCFLTVKMFSLEHRLVTHSSIPECRRISKDLWMIPSDEF
ncbi:GRAM domain-containing protein 2B-like isoform X2 [Stigmatopora argus]